MCEGQEVAAGNAPRVVEGQKAATGPEGQGGGQVAIKNSEGQAADGRGAGRVEGQDVGDKSTSEQYPRGSTQSRGDGGYR